MLRFLYTLLLLLTAASYLPPWLEPTEHHSIAILGLVAPGIWLVTLLSTVMICWLRSSWAWIGVIVLLGGWPSWKNIIALPNSTTVDGPQFRVASFNTNNLIIETGKANQLRQDTAIATFIQQLNADVLCIQEYRLRHTDRLTATIQAVNTYPYFYRYGESRLAIFSRFPLRNGYTKYFSDDSTNGYTHIKVESSMGSFVLFNVHLQSNAITGLTKAVREQPLRDKRRLKWLKLIVQYYTTAKQERVVQAEEIYQASQQFSLPILMCGDLNDIPHSYVYRQFRTHLQDAHLVQGLGLGKTYQGLLPWLRIDYIFPDPSFKVLKFEKYPCSFSDHNAIVATLQ